MLRGYMLGFLNSWHARGGGGFCFIRPIPSQASPLLGVLQTPVALGSLSLLLLLLTMLWLQCLP